MRKKEYIYSISTWIHHISTFIGLFTGIYYLTKQPLPGKKRNLLKRFLLMIFTMIQSWAAVKILSDISNGSSRLCKSYEEIHKLSSSKRQEKGILCGMIFLSSAFKAGFPHLLA